MPYLYLTAVEGQLTTPQRAALVALVNELWPGTIANLRHVAFDRDGANVRFHLVGKLSVADPALLPAGELLVERVA